MTTEAPSKPKDDWRAARNSFSGRLLTGEQFEDAMAITAVIQREIWKTGTFKDKLADYAHAFARSERFDAMKAETIVRDLFKERFGETMNQLRESLLAREQTITEADRRQAYTNACGIRNAIENGTKVAFARAYAFQADDLAATLGITQVTAKTLMREEFKAAESMELTDWGKDLEARFYRPQIEAETREREAVRARGEAQTASRTRTGPSGP
ncbi:hypothetical protein HNR00_003413 [Methylorubrum rhodinum]|uniref:Uncharacterized protein n=1 Tax=Methylorubrum rhodinum TaxID=29428 RepID=A0A840ZMY4_9HYPH|nr:hypothetical protein [Methylorubrum rhodinum]MBB5758690.1 hypothetical protein [Methylorubrum rhodinum]